MKVLLILCLKLLVLGFMFVLFHDELDQNELKLLFSILREFSH